MSDFIIGWLKFCICVVDVLKRYFKYFYKFKICIKRKKQFPIIAKILTTVNESIADFEKFQNAQILIWSAKIKIIFGNFYAETSEFFF